MISVSFNRNTACATSGAGTANNSGAPEFVFGFLRNVLWIIVWFYYIGVSEKETIQLYN